MTDPSPEPAQLADEVAGQISQLTLLLAGSPPKEAVQILARVLDYDDGILGRVAALVAAGSRFAQNRSLHGDLVPEVWLALGRAASELDSVGADLDEHAGTIKPLAARAAPTSSTAAAPAMVVRRHR